MPPAVLTIQTADIGFNPTEDRLLLRTDGSPPVLLLTRRLTSGLLQILADALARSNPVVERTPAALRDQVIMMEHVDALVRRDEASTRPVPAACPLLSLVPLVTRVDIHTLQNGRLQLDFYTRQGLLIKAPMQRRECHRLLAILHHGAVQAQWDIQVNTGWLAQAGSAVQTPRRADA